MSDTYAPFREAVTVSYPYTEEEKQELAESSVLQYGFYAQLKVSEKYTGIPYRLFITGANVYRVYINGQMVLHGPARTAHHYARVDETDITPYLSSGISHIAVELMVYGNTYSGYSNDCTLGSIGFLQCEVRQGNTVYLATGDEAWTVCRLPQRDRRVRRISHCREAMEIYHLDDGYLSWRNGIFSGKPAKPSALTEGVPHYLSHETARPDLSDYRFRNLVGCNSCFLDASVQVKPQFFDSVPGYYPEGYLASVSENPTEDCQKTAERAGKALTVTRDGDSVLIQGTDSLCVLYDGETSIVGFPHIECFCERAGVIDIVRSEILREDGSTDYPFHNVTRLYVPAGHTVFTAMEPGIARYLKLYFRGTGNVRVATVSMIRYSYPDEHRASFLCSDGDINRICQAARETLLLNTLDVFMDCPDRERGGWLCDSLWTARGANLMLADRRVEREHLENFLLTPSDGMFHGFFPEVYPGNKPDYRSMTGITTWSFWLMEEVCEYIRRSGDQEFRSRFAERIADFVEGSRFFIGKSGLLENLPWLFIDWSLSNSPEYQQPVSVPANALYAKVLISLGQCFDHPEWAERGKQMRELLRNAITGGSAFTVRTLVRLPDNLQIRQDGTLAPGAKSSEAGVFTAMWAGLFSKEEVPALCSHIRDFMGPAPLYPHDPEIGTAQLFIGLCIRLDLLSKLGYYDKMAEEMRAIYLPQLFEGPGTLWESTSPEGTSRCHGFNAHAGVLCMRDILGIREPDMTGNRITVAPHLCGLRWAKGTMDTDCGLISVSWYCSGESFRMDISYPEALSLRVILPREVKMFDNSRIQIHINGKQTEDLSPFWNA